MVNDTYYNEFLTRLQNGEHADDIAASITEALNQAMTEHHALQEKEKNKANKVNDADAVCEVIVDFVHTYYPDCHDFDELTGEILISTLEDSMSLIKTCHSFIQEMKNMFNVETSTEKVRASSRIKDPIDRFLDEYVRNR